MSFYGDKGAARAEFQGLALRGSWPLGGVVVGASVLVLLCWIPLKQRPGLGTLSNALVVGPVIALSLQVLPEPRALGLRGALLVLGIVLNGVATGLYIGAGLGPGPRDGLMTGLAARGHSIRAVRTAIELAVLTTGWLLGGSVGVGTVLYGVSIGPLAHVFIPLFSSTGPQKVAVECDSVLDRPSASRKEGQSCVAWGSS